MADKSVGELIAAQSVTPTDLFVLEQNGTAKKLTGQILENWLVSFADGHGGIQSIAKLSTIGLADTYRITLADTTTFDFVVTNGRSITGISKTGTSGLVDTYTISYNNGTTSTFTVTNGAKGDKGDNAYVWIKYAAQEPTESSHSMGDIPDDWIGIYSGNASTAPTDWQQYTWYQIKGEKGDTGAAATVTGTTVEYMISDSGTIVPSGSWSTTIPTVPQGKYLWTRVTTTFNTGSPAVSYSVTRMGLDGTGSVSTVNDKSPDESGNVALTAADIATSGGISVEAKLDTLDEEKQPLLTPGDNISISGSVIATKAFPCNPNLLDNWYFGNPVNQRGQTSYTGLGYTIDRWCNVYSNTSTVQLSKDGLKLDASSAPGQTVEFLQYIDSANIVKGQKLTLSVLLKNGYKSITFTINDAVSFDGPEISVGDRWYLDLYKGSSDQYYQVRFFTTTGGNLSYNPILAVKLELGSQQTLAHQENGAWVLNEIPDYGEQLMRCQRYYRSLFKPNVDYAVPATATTEGVLHLDYALNPTMRTSPALVGDTHGALRIVAYSVNDLSVAIAEPCDYIALVTNGNSVDRATLKIVPNSGVSLVGKYCFTVDTFGISTELGLSADL